jgi:hypothetical protein
MSESYGDIYAHVVANADEVSLNRGKKGVARAYLEINKHVYT